MATDPTRYARRESIDSVAHIICVLCDAKHIDFPGFGAADLLKSSDRISWQPQQPGVVRPSTRRNQPQRDPFYLLMFQYLVGSQVQAAVPTNYNQTLDIVEQSVGNFLSGCVQILAVNPL